MGRGGGCCVDGGLGVQRWGLTHTTPPWDPPQPLPGPPVPQRCPHGSTKHQTAAGEPWDAAVLAPPAQPRLPTDPPVLPFPSCHRTHLNHAPRK